MDKNQLATKQDGSISSGVNLSESYTLAHDLRNFKLPTSKELYDSADPKDRNAFFDGEEGIDFIQENNLIFLTPNAAAKAAQPCGGSKKQQQQNVKPVAVLEQQYSQQQMQQLDI